MFIGKAKNDHMNRIFKSSSGLSYNCKYSRLETPDKDKWSSFFVSTIRSLEFFLLVMPGIEDKTFLFE